MSLRGDVRSDDAQFALVADGKAKKRGESMTTVVVKIATVATPLFAPVRRSGTSSSPSAMGWYYTLAWACTLSKTAVIRIFWGRYHLPFRAHLNPVSCHACDALLLGITEGRVTLRMATCIGKTVDLVPEVSRLATMTATCWRREELSYTVVPGIKLSLVDSCRTGITPHSEMQ
ncbi:hypothetical protein PUNSTDRAFT_48094 [Punctularia strigosozonata HHB-11173 SS5]|uniref:Uncharacterized protein n=1 Tax=Punctularia strigosozonata (strain HHB-11173) TaxID=741275 RepID=R7S2H1_PUNST|nr:uncharacterized protein PUNSTDRAFT_48094 [Punctularia strigosozonata HHB-11173 SS5]EIN03446.1 hypothetical protein PUNSTDRAFT_48094 [Punctularia strigosozonata HHB-11173 SS5]